MIQSNELRIGNYIKYGEKTFTVLEISSDDVLVNTNRGKIKFGIKDIEPIPLTEKWLLKFDFKKGIKGFWFMGGVEYNTKKQILEGFGHCEIKSVHQLQNLYFALTNEELKIK